ncbi:MAG TPA: rod shape-determining protein MreC [Terriglobales bacterium]|nr:rod shape-determining protein MreC [Terriglobales bacterium]
MENFFTRYRNVTLLMVTLMAQIIALASQVRHATAETQSGESMSLIRFWVVESLMPAEKALNATGDGIRDLWRNYIDLRGVRSQNEALQEQLDQLRLEEVTLAEDASQARRLQALLAFKEKFISQTVAAQVIGTGGSEHSHVLYIDKGSHDGVKEDMAVITPRGIVGKISDVFPDGHTAKVLEINDATAGAGVMLERSRLRGVLRGTASGIPEIMHVMSDEKIEPGEPVVASGGDRIYPRGLPIGTVFSVSADADGGPFKVVRVKPSANLDKVEEVLVITKIIEKEPPQQPADTSLRAADILAQRLPTVVPKPPQEIPAEPPSTAMLYGAKGKKSVATAEDGEGVPSGIDHVTKTTSERAAPSTAPKASTAPKIENPKPQPPKPAAPAANSEQTPQENPQ